MKRRAALASILTLCSACLGETSAQEPIPLFDVEDKEPQAPVAPPDPGPPAHPTAPPPKPQPLVFAPGQLPWAPAGYTVYFHLKEEAEWTENYLGKIPGQSIATTHANRIAFTPLAFLPQQYIELSRLSNRRSFQAIDMPPSFFGELKELHFFEINNKGYYHINNVYTKDGSVYHYTINNSIEDFFLKTICNLQSDPSKCSTIEGYYITSANVNNLNKAETFKIQTKYIHSLGDVDRILKTEDLESQNPEKTWKESCRDMGWAIYDQRERFGDTLRDVKLCSPLSIETPFNEQKYIETGINKIIKLNPKD